MAPVASFDPFLCGNVMLKLLLHPELTHQSRPGFGLSALSQPQRTVALGSS